MNNKQTPIFMFSLLLIGLGCFFVFSAKQKQELLMPLSGRLKPTTFWEIQAIDTMKYSRDIAREKMNDQSFDAVIDTQVKNIASTGATHVAISTPYDAEFIPFLERWVKAARKYELKVWFRGNMAGWEGWFEYPRIGREEHTKQVEAFILANQDLFEDGDLFVSCPECENGGPGDPRMKGDKEEYREFLIQEYTVVKKAFETINRDVQSNLYSMNGDVARLIMDRETTAKLDGIIVIDHYVKTTDQLLTDIRAYAEQSGGKVVLGEWGAPIPDIHGEMTQQEQAAWLEDANRKFVKEPSIIGMNYWTHTGSSTELWENGDKPKQSVDVITKYYKPTVLTGTITDTNGRPINGAKITTPYSTTYSVKGIYEIPVLQNEPITITVSKEEYVTNSLEVTPQNSISLERDITIEKV